MEFEVKKTGSLVKELKTIIPGEVFYVPADKIYCMRVTGGFVHDDVKVVDINNGLCYLYNPYAEVVPVIMKVSIENPYLRD